MKLFVILALLGFVFCEKKDYSSYKVVEIKSRDEETAHFINNLAQHNEIDVWSAAIKGQPGLVMVEQKNLKMLASQLKEHNLESEIVVDNVQKLIDENAPAPSVAFRRGKAASDFRLDKYHSHQEINDFLEALASENPDKVSIINIGKSFQGRDMKMAKIGKGSGGKRSVIIEAGLHAREWIAVTTPTYVISELATNPEYDQLITDLDIYILPVANPDGYEYSREENRLWRKTRSPQERNCFGTDPNRNFPFKWEVGTGTSDDPCSDIFRGPSEASEIEVQNIVKFVRENKMEIDARAYLTIHTYSQFIGHSWGYARNTYPPDVDDLKKVAEDAADALKEVNGRTYDVDSSGNFAPVTGASDDFAKDLEIKYSYLFELAPKCCGFGGFVRPESEILGTARETFAAIKVMFQAVKDLPE